MKTTIDLLLSAIKENAPELHDELIMLGNLEKHLKMKEDMVVGKVSDLAKEGLPNNQAYKIAMEEAVLSYEGNPTPFAEVDPYDIDEAERRFGIEQDFPDHTPKWQIKGIERKHFLYPIKVLKNNHPERYNKLKDGMLTELYLELKQEDEIDIFIRLGVEDENQIIDHNQWMKAWDEVLVEPPTIEEFEEMNYKYEIEELEWFGINSIPEYWFLYGNDDDCRKERQELAEGILLEAPHKGYRSFRELVVHLGDSVPIWLNKNFEILKASFIQLIIEGERETEDLNALAKLRIDNAELEPLYLDDIPDRELTYAVAELIEKRQFLSYKDNGQISRKLIYTSGNLGIKGFYRVIQWLGEGSLLEGWIKKNYQVFKEEYIYYLNSNKVQLEDADEIRMDSFEDALSRGQYESFKIDNAEHFKNELEKNARVGLVKESEETTTTTKKNSVVDNLQRKVERIAETGDTNAQNLSDEFHFRFMDEVPDRWIEEADALVTEAKLINPKLILDNSSPEILRIDSNSKDEVESEIQPIVAPSFDTNTLEIDGEGSSINMMKETKKRGWKQLLVILLTPLTMYIWYELTYFSIFLILTGMVLVYSFSWFWLILTGGFVLWLVSIISEMLPLAAFLLLSRLYGANLFSVMAHSIAAIIGITLVSIFYFNNPPTIILGTNEVNALKHMWETEPIKMVMVTFPFLGLIFSLVISMVVRPFALLEKS